MSRHRWRPDGTDFLTGELRKGAGGSVRADATGRWWAVAWSGERVDYIDPKRAPGYATAAAAKRVVAQWLDKHAPKRPK